MLDQRVGLEFEGVVLNSDKQLVENVDELDIFQNRTIGKETTFDRLEVRSEPHLSVEESFSEIINLIEDNNLNSKNIFLPFNYGGSIEEVIFRKESLSNVKKKFLGINYSFEGLTRGYHIHFTLPKDESEIVNNYNVLLALDTFGIGMMNSYSEKKSAWRPNGYRNLVYEKQPFFGNTPNYMISFSEHVKELTDNFNRLCKKNWDNGGEEYSKRSNPFSAINGPLRIRMSSDEERTSGYDNTIEVRTPDSNPLWTLNYAYTDLLFWIVNQSSHKDIMFTDKPIFQMTDKLIRIPKNHTNYYLSEIAISDGLSNPWVKNYCNDVLSSARKTGYNNEFAIGVLEDVLSSEKTFAKTLLEYESNCKLSNNVDGVYSFVSDVAQKELENLKKHVVLENV